MYKHNLVDTANSELYQANATSGVPNPGYDGLNRLTHFERGTLSASGYNGTTLDTVSSPSKTQSFALDQLGNQSVTTNGTTVTNTTNSRNELTGSGGSTLTFDANGNTTTDQAGNTYTYDAWNHAITITNPATENVTTYSYNAQGNRVTTNDSIITTIGPVAVIDNGSPQRSMVDSVTVIFPSAVTLSSGAITLDNVTGSYTESTTYSNPSGDGKTWLVSFTGTDISVGSLPNGVFDLVVHHADVSGITLSADVTWAFHRLFGDINGDGTVNSTDYAVFLQDFTSTTYAPQYDPAFDANGDHRVFNSDYSFFNFDYGTSETYTATGAPFVTAPPAGSSVLDDVSPWVPVAPVNHDLYYSPMGQVLEDQANGVTAVQNVYNIDYVNDLLLTDNNSTSGDLGLTGSGLGQRLFAQHDANFNVTALADSTGTVVERYMYDPYGNVTVLQPDGTVRGDGTLASSHFGVPNLFQGMRVDSVTGLYQTPNRDYSPVLGRWMEQDPAGYVNGANSYRFAISSPLDFTDSLGLAPDATSQPSPLPPAIQKIVARLGGDDPNDRDAAGRDLGDQMAADSSQDLSNALTKEWQQNQDDEASSRLRGLLDGIQIRIAPNVIPKGTNTELQIFRVSAGGNPRNVTSADFPPKAQLWIQWDPAWVNPSLQGVRLAYRGPGLIEIDYREIVNKNHFAIQLGTWRCGSTAIEVDYTEVDNPKDTDFIKRRAFLWILPPGDPVPTDPVVGRGA